MQRSLRTFLACNGAWLTSKIGFSRYSKVTQSKESIWSIHWIFIHFLPILCTLTFSIRFILYLSSTFDLFFFTLLLSLFFIFSPFSFSTFQERMRTFLCSHVAHRYPYFVPLSINFCHSKLKDFPNS